MILRRVARPLLGAIFVYGGINALRDLQGPTEPDAGVRVDALVKIGAGVALAFGFLPRLAALLLTGSLVPTTLAAHRFWEHDDPKERSAQEVQFLKNLGLAGGLLLASADTHGHPSLGWRARHAARDAADAVADTAETVERKAKSAVAPLAAPFR